MGIEAKQESKSTNEIGKLMLKASSSSTTTTSRQWSGFKNPRIVRVSRRFGGKDRHSKVCTIRGLRDRRIRLSVPTAIQLYDLQHRLGLGQPSKVIDWLLDATTNDIDQLPPLDHIPQGFGTTHFPLHHQQQQQQQFLFPHHHEIDDDDSNSLKGKGKVEDQILENINNEDHHQLFTQSFFPIGYNNGMTTYNYYHSDPCSNLSLYPPLPQIKDSHEAYCSSSRSSLPFGSHPQLLFYPSMATSTSTTLPLFSAPYVNGATQLENDEYPRQFNQFQFLNPPTNSSQEVPHHSLLPSSNPYFQKERYNENK